MKLNDILNESREFVIIDPRGNARPVGSKMQGAMYLKKMGGAKRGYHMVLKKNALKARRAIEKNGGNSTNSKIQNIMFDLMYEGKVNEAYVESMDYPVLKKALDTIVDKWSDWKKGPMTEPGDIKPAQKELMNFVSSYLKKNIK